MTVLDLHLLSPASATVILALIGAAAVTVGLGLRSLLKRQAPRHPGGSAAEDSPPSCVVSSDVRVGRGTQPAALVAISRLADVLDRSRRLVAAEERVARELTCADGWVVERYVLVGLHRVPFVLIGPSGIFALCATDGAWTLYDLEVLSRLGEELRGRLPGYRGRVEAVVCLAFDHAEPRTWYGGADRGGRGGWVLGVDQLLPWLCGWEPTHGLAADDVSRIAVEAGPHWRRRSTTRLPVSGNAG